MKTKILLCVLCVLCGESAFAVVGDDEQRIEHLYGKSFGTWDDFISVKKGYRSMKCTITVNFEKGVSRMERFENQDGSEMTPTVLAEMLGLQTIKSMAHWKPSNLPDLGEKQFVTEDGKLIAWYDGSVFTVADRSFFEAKNTAARTAWKNPDRHDGD